MSIKLVVFDLAGTTVDDDINGLPLVTVAMKDAFKKSGFEMRPESVDDVRGMEKKDAIKALLEIITKEAPESSLVDKIFSEFKLSLNENLSKLRKEIPGTTDVFLKLKNENIKVAVGSGFPQAVVLNIVSALNWVEMVDFVSSAEAEGHGRPHPCLIESAMAKFNISNAKEVVKVGDTKLDIQEGKNAGCWTVAVLTGTQGKTKLAGENPDFIVDSIADLPEIITKIQLCK